MSENKELDENKNEEEMKLVAVAKEHLSASQVSSFERCPASFIYSLLVKQNNKDGNPFLAFGDAIHLAIEKLSDLALEKLDGKTYLLTEIDVKKVWHEILAKYPQLVSQSVIERGDKQLSYWHRSEIQREAKVVGSEIAFDLYLPSGVKLVGFIDRVEENKYTDSESLDLWDWKTGWLKEDYSTAMAIYRIAGYFLYPDKKVTPKVMQLQHNYVDPYSFSLSEIEEFYEYLEIVRNAINNIVDQLNHIIATDPGTIRKFIDSVARINRYCHYCNRAQDHACLPWKKNLYAFSHNRETNIENVSEIVDRYELLETVKKGIEVEMQKMDVYVENLLYGNDLKGVALPDGRWLNPFVTTRTKIQADKIVPILIRNGKWDALTTGVKAVKTAMCTLPEETQEQINPLISEVRGNISWRIGKKQKDLS